MTISLHGLATALQTLLTNDADTAAKESGFIARKRRSQRRLRPDLGFRLDERTPTQCFLEDLAAPLGVPFNLPTSGSTPKPWTVSRTSFEGDGRWSSRAGPRRFLCCVVSPKWSWKTAPASTLTGEPRWQVSRCGGLSPEAGKAGLESHSANRDHHRRGVRPIDLAAGRVDRTLHASPPPLPPGSPPDRIDLGFFDLERLEHDTAQGISGLVGCRHASEPEPLASRLECGPVLQRQMSDRVDTLVTLGSKGRRLTCRLVAIRTCRRWPACRSGWRKPRRRRGGSRARPMRALPVDGVDH